MTANVKANHMTVILLSKRHLMTVLINMHKPYFIFKTSCHGYEGVMSVLYTPLQVKCYPKMIYKPTHKITGTT